MGGPSQTLAEVGIVNADWFITQGGDGYESQIDPVDPNIVYSQYQYGGLTRYNKATGENIDIQPKPGKGEAPYRWNWDTPLLISPHNHFAIQAGDFRLQFFAFPFGEWNDLTLKDRVYNFAHKPVI